MAAWTPMLLVSLAVATERPEIRAEHVRLSEEMARLSGENRWDGVDSHYRSLVALRGGEPSYQDHWLGAQAASAQGDVQATWDRLKDALDVDFTGEALAWRAAIEARYGEVTISVKRSYGGPRALSVAMPPLDPEPRATIDAARGAVQADGLYRGLLPHGQYTLGDTEFEIVGGPTVHVVLR